MKKLSLLSALLLCIVLLHAQTGVPIELHTMSGNIKGTLLMPVTDKTAKVPVALLIAGSGPTDRDGNSGNIAQNNSLKMLAEALYKKGIATVRYDKRGIAESKDAGVMESDLRFEDYVDDARGWIKLLKIDMRFSKVIVIGHSEGSLIGMIAAQGMADAYVSVAGAGQPADKILREQLKAQGATISAQADRMLDTLVKGDTLKYVPNGYAALFRPSVQPYMISWFKYDPQKEIKKLTIPVLIIQGTVDIQVSINDAQRLAAGNPKAKMVIIPGMNHIFKPADADRAKNIATYSNPTLPIVPLFASTISDFILQLK